MNSSIDWSKVQSEARRNGQSVLDTVQTQTGLGRLDAMALLGQCLTLPILDEPTLRGLAARFDLVSMADADRMNVLAVEHQGQPAVVLSDPLDAQLEQELSTYFAEGYARRLALPEVITAILRHHTQSAPSADIQSVTPPAAEASASGTPGHPDAPISQRMQQLLHDAMQNGASDIHLENSTHGMAVKYRIDGVLTLASQLDTLTVAEQMISRLKVMAELDIAERRTPQDGRFQARVLGRDVDFRVSIMPGLMGEDAVIRILDRYALTLDSSQLTLDRIGFDGSTLAQLRDMIRAPYGMVLVTGPTGSGKTTTLYAALNEIHNGEDKIITIEDPVEYQLRGILQIPVNERKGLTFARGLRSILRHDPDKIMVGEIRDQETAEIAVQAALTGHLVFTTVHANNVFDVIGRFSHMGVDAYNFVSSLTGILAQRLLRLNCPRCSSDVTPSAADLQRAGITQQQATAWIFRAGSGCDHCHATGYKGRQAIVELLPLSDELRDLIIARATTRQLKEKARHHGMHSLRESALALVKNGMTTIQEVDRVTFME